MITSELFAKTGISAHIPEQSPTEIATAALDMVGELDLVDANLAERPNRGIHFNMANDIGFDRIIRSLSKNVPRPDGQVGVGLVIGSGYLHSSLPELPVDMVVRADFDTAVLSWQSNTDERLQDMRTRKQYEDDRRDEDRYTRRFNYERYRTSGFMKNWVEMPSTEIAGVNERHFLASQRRYKQVRKAHSRTPIVPVGLDVSNKDVVATLASSIRSVNGVITYANFTNVWEYLGDKVDDIDEILDAENRFKASLGQLPVHEDALIAFSATQSEGPEATYPVAQSAIGLEGYFHDASEMYENVSHGSIRAALRKRMGLGK